MENEALNKNNFVDLEIIKSLINKRNIKFSKNNIFIFLFLIELLLIILLLFFFFKLKFIKSNNTIVSPDIKPPTATAMEVIDFEKKLKELQNSSIEWPLPDKIKFKPFMTIKDLKGFLSFMKPNVTYFEFGSGGSTNVASYYKLKVYSVESQVSFHNKLKNSNINATYITIDLKANNLGYPGKNTNVEDWKRYFQSYDSKYNADIILIDGRFRVACGLDIFPKIRSDTLVLVHDYENRKSYHILENYYIKVKTWDTLSAFFKNPNITSIPQKVYNSYMYEKQL